MVTNSILVPKPSFVPELTTLSLYRYGNTQQRGNMIPRATALYCQIQLLSDNEVLHTKVNDFREQVILSDLPVGDCYPGIWEIKNNIGC